MELLLNLVWIAISSAALLAWLRWRRSSTSTAVPQMMTGTMVVVCILILLFPIISISDDLSQTMSLAEGNRMQDVLKAPELRGIYYLSPILPSLLLELQRESCGFKRSVALRLPPVLDEISWSPTIEKRPPPSA